MWFLVKFQVGAPFNMKTEQQKQLIESNIGKKVKVKIANDNNEQWYGIEGIVDRVVWQLDDFGFYMVVFKDINGTKDKVTGKYGQPLIGNVFEGAFNVDRYLLKFP